MFANLLTEQTVIGVLQLLVGKVLKKNPKVDNKVIPVLTFIVAIFGFSIAPASAGAAGSLPLGPATNILVAALLQNLMVTGVHSTFKNTVVPALKPVGMFFMQWFIKKAN